MQHIPHKVENSGKVGLECIATLMCHINQTNLNSSINKEKCHHFVANALKTEFDLCMYFHGSKSQ